MAFKVHPKSPLGSGGHTAEGSWLSRRAHWLKLLQGAMLPWQGAAGSAVTHVIWDNLGAFAVSQAPPKPLLEEMEQVASPFPSSIWAGCASRSLHTFKASVFIAYMQTSFKEGKLYSRLKLVWKPVNCKREVAQTLLVLFSCLCLPRFLRKI